MPKQTLTLPDIPLIISTLSAGTYLVGSLSLDNYGRITTITPPSSAVAGSNVVAISESSGRIAVTTLATTATINLSNSFSPATYSSGYSNSMTIDSYGRVTQLSQLQSSGGGTYNYISAIQIRAGSGLISSISSYTTATQNTFTSLTYAPISNSVMNTVGELYNTKSGATGVVAHDFNTGGQWVHTAITGNFTANFTNIPTSPSYFMINLSLHLYQGATPYLPTAVQINGSAQSIKWAGATGTPTGTANVYEVMTFTILNLGGTFTVLGGLASYG